MGVDVVRDLGLPDRRDAAAAALVALGSDALPPLVDESSQVVRREITAALGRIGGAGFEAVLRGLLDAPTEESRHRVGFAFSRYGAAALGRYVDAPSHPSPLVRLQAVRGIRQCDEAGPPAVPALLPLLGDPVREGAQQAQDTWSSEAGAWCRCCSASAGKVRAGSGRGR
ncbi:HEAT repeat domain-containing protein [Streptomyces sp. NPDC056352]|uniref:HEAT repeat domain-containing protein n=1 Tax=Streptomyces sp. NPDC056352 TaxID=3345791 RepID=UPI0035D842C9